MDGIAKQKAQTAFNLCRELATLGSKALIYNQMLLKGSNPLIFKIARRRAIARPKNAPCFLLI